MTNEEQRIFDALHYSWEQRNDIIKLLCEGSHADLIPMIEKQNALVEQLIAQINQKERE